jgi:sugar lactone lactonase YvrE
MPDGSGLTELVGAAANLPRPEGLEFGDFNGARAPALYAAETAGQRIVQIAANGTVTTFGDPSAIGGLRWPDNIAFGPDGYLYAGEQIGAGSRVVRIAADGTHSVYATGFDNIAGVAFDPTTGYLYIGEIDHSTIWRVRP